MALGTAGLRDDPPPPGDSRFLEAPSFARRLAAGSFVLSSPGEAPAKKAMREEGHPSGGSLEGKAAEERCPRFLQFLLAPGASSFALLFSCRLSHTRALKGLLGVLWVVAGLC